MIRKLLKCYYPTAEYIPANNGLEAYRKYLDQQKNSVKPDLVFMDQLMPQMDGIQAAEKILEHDPSAYIIMVTANIQDSTRSEADAIGIKGVIHKPIEKNSFVQVLNAWEKARAANLG